MKLIDLVGQRFGKLVVQCRGPKKPYRHVTWRCLCDCGGIAPAVMAGNLKNGNTTSCGCHKREVHRALAAIKFTKHGGCTRKNPSPEWRSWASMLRRCDWPRHINFADYGGRGISVCDRWRESFEAFRADMGKHPGPGYSLGRIDVNGNYEPGNCKWETYYEQVRNRRPFSEWKKWKDDDPRRRSGRSYQKN